MSLHSLLLARKANNNPIRVGVIGAGKFGSMFLSQAIRIPGVHVVGIADLNPEQAKSNLANVHWTPEQYGAGSFNEAMRNGTTFVSDSVEALVSHPA
ncbi:MAG: Gfo/Idh/MocA family oxidoreductase, partial [Natronospirillum sp.]